MDFLAVIIAFVISLSVSGHIEPAAKVARKWRVLAFNERINVKFSLFLYALLPALLVGLFLYWVQSGLLTFVFSVAFLILAFESADQPEKLADYHRKLEAEDEQGAWQLAVDELGLERHIYEPGDDAIDEGVQGGLGYLYLERFFVTVFWFVTFGVAGVFLVWLTRLIFKDEAVDPFCYRVKQALYWIPVRLMAFTLALMGNFADCFPVWLKQATEFDRDDRVILVTCLQSALGSVSSDKLLPETLALLKRTQWSWLVGLALLFIFG